MTKLNLIKKKISKEDLEVSVTNPLKLLVGSFNGVVIQIDEENSYES